MVQIVKPNGFVIYGGGRSLERLVKGTLVPKRFTDLPHTSFAITDVISALKEFGRFVSNMPLGRLSP